MRPGSRYLAVLFAAIVLLTGSTGFSQTTDEELPPGVVPPPLNLLSKQEKTELESERKMKNRTKLALQFMDDRLKLSEKATETDDFPEALAQLGRFQALIRNTAGYLKGNEGNKGSFKNFKRFEMTLREFIPRLELIRRELPYEYGYHVRELMKFVSDTRMNALEPFFDDTVIPEGGSR
ncbi:MAG: hypothetical protein DWQ47_02045 [Acidobacteria bacterium]|nr:MAG: hypothetical protein DWQ32_05595 [Acidobacteriota bacterium]REK01204.1 MAG: hypothetical protein DWQ38_02030 [Acidobacteriota bacterium]REK14160.1 MAG: hypothetical protein DWQ43_11285 [Acidobacteriota bacterium]REK44875.1 MAG: hypothetical protein DWQ47_02045 [Acidobacteriota bacterium]